MPDMNVDFIGGTLDGENRSPINEEELSSLGYRVQVNGQLRGEELVHCLAVPADWTPEEGHKAVREKLSPKNRRC